MIAGKNVGGPRRLSSCRRAWNVQTGILRRGGLRSGRHHFGLRELFDLHGSLVVDLLATEGLVNELLGSVDHAQIPLGLSKLRIQIELH